MIRLIKLRNQKKKYSILERHISNALATLTVKLQLKLKAFHLQSSFTQKDFFLQLY